MNKQLNSYFIIWCTLFLALLLQIFVWSDFFAYLKPHWLMLVLIYWVLALPHRVGIATAFLVGAILDLFSGTVLGVHASLFSLITFLAAFRFQLIRNLALWQQSLVIFGLSVIYNLGLIFYQIVIYHMITISPFIFLSSISDGILWTWVFLLLRQIRRYFSVN